MPTKTAINVGTIGFDAGSWSTCITTENAKEPTKMPSVYLDITGNQKFDLGSLIVQCRQDFTSAIIRTKTKTFLFGAIAAMNGGRPIFELGKPKHQIDMFMASLAGLAPYAQGKEVLIPCLNILVPDSRGGYMSEWEPTQKGLENTLEFEVNGYPMLVAVKDVNFVQEGVAAFSYLDSLGVFSDIQPGESIGLFDIGGFESTFRVAQKVIQQSSSTNAFASFGSEPAADTKNFMLDYGSFRTLPGLSVLARSIAESMGPVFNLTMTPDPLFLLRHMEMKNYLYTVYNRDPVDFTPVYLSCRREYLRHHIDQLSPFYQTVSRVLIIGGGAYHAETVAEATNDWMRPLDSSVVAPELINCNALSKGGFLTAKN